MKFSSIISAVLFLYPVTCFGLPTLYGEKAGIKDDTSSSVIPDTNYKNKFYVLPPTYGSAKALKISGISANVGFCRALSSLQKTYTSDVERMRESDRDIEDMERKYKRDYEPEIEKAQADYRKASLIKTERNQYTILLLDLQRMEDELKEEENSLSQISEKESETYKIKHEEIKLLKKKIKDKQYDVKAQEIKAKDEQNKEDIYREYIETAKEAAQRYKASMEEFKKSREEFASAMMEKYRQLARMEGGKVNVTFQTNWQSNVTKLIADNPGKEFTAINTKNATYYIAFQPKENDVNEFLSTFPTFNYYSVNGFVYSPNKIDVMNGTQKLPGLVDRTSATINLTLVGACPILHPDWFEVASTDKDGPTMNISAGYDYDVAYTTSIEATYNLYYIYEKLKSCSTRGGFWRSTTSCTESTVMGGESTPGIDSIEVVFKSEHDKYSAEDKRKMADDVRKRIFERVLALTSHPAGSPDYAYLKSMEAPPTGAVVLAKQFASIPICGYQSWYCMATSWVIGILPSFSGTTSEQSFKLKYNVVVTDKYRETEATSISAFTAMGQYE